MVQICGNDHTSSLITAWRKLDVLMTPTVQESLSAAALQRPEAATAPSAHDREGKKTYLFDCIIGDARVFFTFTPEEKT